MYPERLWHSIFLNIFLCRFLKQFSTVTIANEWIEPIILICLCDTSDEWIIRVWSNQETNDSFENWKDASRRFPLPILEERETNRPLVIDIRMVNWGHEFKARRSKWVADREYKFYFEFTALNWVKKLDERGDNVPCMEYLKDPRWCLSIRGGCHLKSGLNWY